MGWWEDIAHPIGRAATSVAHTVGNLVSAPIEGVGDILQGRDFVQVIEEKGKKAYGAYVNLATGGGVAQSEDAQRILRDSDLSGLTFGFTDNYAGFMSIGGKFQSGAEVTQDEWNRAGRFGAQIATVAVAGGAGNTGINLLGSSEAGTSVFTLQNYGVAHVAAPMLARGDVKGLAALAGVAAPITNLLPSNPATPPPRSSQPLPGPTQPQTPSADYWGSNGGAVGNSFGAFGMSAETLILTGAAVLAGLLITRRI